jgi:NDP-sugar pyrophosphorylase family protein
MTETLLVPSAGLVPKEMRLDLGDLPTALIPLDGKPVLRHINAQYEMFSHIKKYIAINERTQQVQQYLKAADIPWVTVDVGG